MKRKTHETAFFFVASKKILGIIPESYIVIVVGLKRNVRSSQFSGFKSAFVCKI